MRVYPFDDIRRAERTGMASNLPAAFENCDGRYALDPKLSSYMPFGVRVDLCQTYRGFQFRSGLFERRGHRLAGPAPGSPEINNNGDVIAFDKFAERAVRQVQWFPVKQRFMAFAAVRFVR